MLRRRRSTRTQPDHPAPTGPAPLQPAATFAANELKQQLQAALAAADLSTVDQIFGAAGWSTQDWLLANCAFSQASRHALQELARQSTDHPKLAVGAAWAEYFSAADEVATAEASRIATNSTWARYYDSLQSVESSAERALALDPRSPLPWRVLTYLARETAIGRPEQDYRLMEYRRYNPTGFAGCLDFAIAVLGSEGHDGPPLPEDVKNMVNAEPPGSPIYAVIACLLCHYVMTTDKDYDDYVIDLYPELKAASQQSIDHPDFPTSLDEIDALEALNAFAIARAAMRDDEAADDALRRIAGRYIPSPLSRSFDTTESIIRPREAPAD